MNMMATALPNLQQITLGGPRGRDEDIYSNGEDPNEIVAQRTVNYTTHDVNIISGFRKMQALQICGAPLNGRYDFLSSFPLLQKFSMQYLDNLKLDLEMLSRLPLLKVLDCEETYHLFGNIGSLRALKDSLEKVCIRTCPNVTGNFMDLADFPRLKKLDLRCTNVSGDVRDIMIDRNDFPALASLALPSTVHGGINYAFQHVSEVPSLMNTIHLLLQRTPLLFGGRYLFDAFHWSLSVESPDWYAYDLRGLPPPFCLQFVQAGSRLGWSWCTHRKNYEYVNDEISYSCEINWLDPEPSIGSIDYANYMYDLQRIEQHTVFCRRCFQPPTELQYRRLCEGLA